MSTSVCGPIDATSEKPTPFERAQSSIAAVSAPDWHTTPREPARASGPAALALRLSLGRWKPRLFGPSSSTPSRCAIWRSAAAWSAVTPLEMISAARQAMRPATSSAAAMSFGGSAMMARSARVCDSSASVPVVAAPPISRKRIVPAKRCARIASVSARPWAVCCFGSPRRAENTTMASGSSSGCR